MDGMFRSSNKSDYEELIDKASKLNGYNLQIDN